jgi:putative ABC transport system permease protein
MLLVGAGLLGQTLYRLRYADLGLRPERLLTVRTALPVFTKYKEAPRRALFYEEVLERVRRIPGVVSAGYSTSVPLEWRGGTNGFVPDGPVDPKRTYDANHRQVSTDYLTTMGIPLRRGRFFERTDGERSLPVALVNETMARQYWPGQDAVGKRFRVGRDDTAPWITIVGVVGDVRQMGLDAPVKAEMYFPYAQVDGQPWFAPRDLVVRSTAADPTTLVPAVKAAIHAVDPEQAVAAVRTFDEVLDEDVVQRRLGASLVAAFAALALLLASLGVYGVLSYFVAQHTSEIGVRVALGASRSDIFSLVVGKGMGLAASGVALGLLGALALTRLVSSLLYGVGAADPATFAVAAGLLASLALLACYLPARRAMKVDPMVAIRCE